MTSKTLHGIINGKTIELVEDPGVPLGQQVELIITGLAESKPTRSKEQHSHANGLADDWSDEDDRILAEIYQQRKNSSRPLDAE